MRIDPFLYYIVVNESKSIQYALLVIDKLYFLISEGYIF